MEKPKMRKVQKNSLFLPLLIASFFIFGCNAPTENRYGKISVILTGEVPSAPDTARTTFPYVGGVMPTFDKYTYTFTKSGQTDGVELLPDSEGIFILEVGYYTVAVQVFTGAEGSYTLAASGTSLLFYVGSSSSLPIAVPLYGIITEGKGIFSYRVGYPAGADAELALYRWPDMNPVAINPLDGGAGKYQNPTELDAGYYVLTVRLHKNGVSIGKSEAIHIYPGQHTNYTNDFRDSDIFSIAFIENVEITLTAPVKNEPPDTTAYGTGNFTIGEVSWSPAHNPFLGNVEYTATVTLTANEYHTFAALASATLDGEKLTVSNNSGSAVTLSYAFSATDDRIVDNMVIKTQPEKLTYTHNEQLNLAGLVVTLTYDDDTTEDIAAADFAAKHITTTPSQGNHLIHITHDGQPVTVTYGSHLHKTTENVTVNKAPASYFSYPDSWINVTYAPALSLNDIDLRDDYAWVEPATLLYAGGAAQPFYFDAMYTEPSGNYETAYGTIRVYVYKAAGEKPGKPTLNNRTHSSITVNEIIATTGQTVEYGCNRNNSSFSSSVIWQTSPTFTGLEPNTSYYIFARTAGNDNYEISAASDSLYTATLLPVPQTRFEFYWVNEHGRLATTSGGVTNILVGQALTITAQSSGYTVKQWHLNGENTGQNGNTYTFSSTASGRHTVGLFVEKDGNLYNTNITIMVHSVFEITFDINGGTGTAPAARTAEVGKSSTLPYLSGFSREGYSFGEWNTKADGTGNLYTGGLSFTPTEYFATLYAFWYRPITTGGYRIVTITEPNSNQWYRFTASSNVQYVHIGFNTSANLYVQVRDINGNPVMEETIVTGSSGVTRSYSLPSVIPNTNYYIGVSTISGSGEFKLTASHLNSNLWSW